MGVRASIKILPVKKKRTLASLAVRTQPMAVKRQSLVPF